MKKFLQENWFKIIISFCLVIFTFCYIVSSRYIFFSGERHLFRCDKIKGYCSTMVAEGLSDEKRILIK
jgi:hypothetical protein